MKNEKKGNYLEELKSYGLDYQSYLLLKNDYKPVIRITTNKESLKGKLSVLKNIFKTLRLKVLIKEFSELYGKESENSLFNLYISKNEELTKNAYLAEKNNDRLEIGKLLGYPNCCVKSFIENLGKEEYTISSYKKCKTKPSFYCNNIFVFDSKLGNRDVIKFKENYEIFNDTQDLFLIRHIPCSFDCKKSIKIGKKTLSLLDKEKTDLSKEITKTLKRPFLYFDYFKWIVFDGKVDKNKIIYNKVLPIKSMISEEIINKIKMGNKIEVLNNEIIIFDKEKILFEIPKNNENEGSIIDFSN